MPQEMMRRLLADLGVDAPSDVVAIGDGERLLATPLRAAELSASALGAQAALICEIWRMRTGRRQTAALDLEGAALALQSVFYQRQWDYRIALPEPSYPTVDLYPTDDKNWVMINGGYPRLRDGLLDLLQCPDSKEAVAAAVKTWAAPDLEDRAAANGLCAVMVRSREKWLAHPQGAALARAPLVEIKKIGNGPRVGFAGLSKLDPPTGMRPLSGVRVLDLTHVIAGPTCAKILAEQGATVLHVYGPARPQLPPFDIDTGHGKLSAFLDLKQERDWERLRALVKDADVFSESYRPGAVAGLGFEPEKLAEMKPGIIVVSVSCYGFDGPWATRRGFEQLAQAATGIATVQGTEEEPQLALSFYPNDYITGYLAALGTLAALVRRARDGGSYHVRLSLCRTAMHLLEQGLNEPAPAQADVPAAILARYMRERDSALGRLHYLGPVLRYSETPSYWDLPPSPLGAHPPRWPDWA
ncbi:MAG: CoA transferase [Acetobacteraceae bacterium]|nr:CoA transferase [Acetobacteraceae bacterium]